VVNVPWRASFSLRGRLGFDPRESRSTLWIFDAGSAASHFRSCASQSRLARSADYIGLDTKDLALAKRSQRNRARLAALDLTQDVTETIPTTSGAGRDNIEAEETRQNPNAGCATGGWPGNKESEKVTAVEAIASTSKTDPVTSRN
jgi:hypothetical protein